MIMLKTLNTLNRSRTPHGVRGLKLAMAMGSSTRPASHPSRGAWIEIPAEEFEAWAEECRTPHGVRGLKCGGMAVLQHGQRSHPSRGAWIEICSLPRSQYSRRRRTPHGVRGLKCLGSCRRTCAIGRTPHGVRGLKSGEDGAVIIGEVAPLTGCVD